MSTNATLTQSFTHESLTKALKQVAKWIRKRPAEDAVTRIDITQGLDAWNVVVQFERVTA